MEGERAGSEADERTKRWTRRYDRQKGFIGGNRAAEVEVCEVWKGVKKDGDWPHDVFDEARGGLVDD